MLPMDAPWRYSKETRPIDAERKQPEETLGKNTPRRHSEEVVPNNAERKRPQETLSKRFQGDTQKWCSLQTLQQDTTKRPSLKNSRDPEIHSKETPWRNPVKTIQGDTKIQALKCNTLKRPSLETQNRPAVNKIVMRLAPLVEREGCISEEPASESGIKKTGRGKNKSQKRYTVSGSLCLKSFMKVEFPLVW